MVPAEVEMEVTVCVMPEPHCQAPEVRVKAPAVRALVATATVPEAPDLVMAGKVAPDLGVKVWVPEFPVKARVPEPAVTVMPETKVASPVLRVRV